jgi:hypothetical protein
MFVCFELPCILFLLGVGGGAVESCQSFMINITSDRAASKAGTKTPTVIFIGYHVISVIEAEDVLLGITRPKTPIT